MGQKVHPTGIRLGIVKKHTSTWFAEGQEYADNLLVDLQVREFVKKRLANASVSRVDIERPAQTAKITIYTARPGIVIGKKVKTLKPCAEFFQPRWAFPCKSILKKSASLTWTRSWLRIVWLNNWSDVSCFAVP